MVEAKTYAEGTVFAVCILNPDLDSGVKGLVKFTQEPGQKIHVWAEVTGLKEGLHGFHVHQYGKISLAGN